MTIHSLKNTSKTDTYRVALYGKPGVGKTSAAKYMPGKTLIIPFDNSEKVLGGLDVDTETFDKRYTNDELERLIKELPGVIDNYDNLVLDNISALEKSWFIEQGRNSKSGIRNELQDYSGWTNYFIRLIDAFYNFPINILVTAWEDQYEIQTPSGQSFNQFSPMIRNSVRSTFMGLTDVVGRLMINPSTGNRGVILVGDDSIYAKNRLDSRKSCSVEDLFKWGDTAVQTTPISDEPSK